ncbi:hypothetical protein BABINDRAFT_172388 [Babjeviella inositovora NRRL Y-12698]|uniref:Uncharacterized protein n=1 Tax=Babjeviella inositovora NRRL Y-12698 TaxID=984486 RepID=A0A1E3QMP0_9ASCO|nr:uncharacterized protein BABINDRAFT_172388 [Babjeviella inositovora NRRL Y-12698]ODQ78267.1 hypothetical protein BABINDRAFT_172388 [Babjeviella inositovora NRRL Y-12698]
MPDSATQEIILGSFAGSLGKLIEYPFDTIKVKLQSKQYSNTLLCFKLTWKLEGLIGFYRGLTPPLLGASLENACLFYVYNAVQDALKKHIYVMNPSVDFQDQEQYEVPLLGKMVAGATSGVCASFILTPVELIKCNMQVLVSLLTAASQYKPNIFKVIKDVYRREGIAGYWRGQFPTLLREMGGTAIWFGSYEMVSGSFRRYRSQQVERTSSSTPVFDLLVSGASAGVGYNVCLYPVDTIKSNMQINKGDKGNATMKGTIRQIYQESGVRGFYRGLGITVVRCIPANAVIFFTYNKCKEAWFGRS